MVRQIGSELNLIDDPTAYPRSGASWATLKNYGNINLSEAGLIIWKCELYVASGTAYFRLKIGSEYVWLDSSNENTFQPFQGFAWIGTGSKGVVMESYGGSSHTIKNFQLGFVKFKDSDGVAHHVYSGEMTAKVDARKTAVGPLKNAIYAVMAWATTPGEETNFANPGESLTNEVRIKFEGAFKYWTWRRNAGATIECSSAFYHVSSPVNVTRNVIIEKDNANTVIHVCFFGCPWLLVDALHEPLTLSFAQGSTLYVVLEPLNKDATKYIKIGKVRAVSWGDNTDYYSAASGSGILSHSFVFETVEVAEILMSVRSYADGLLACISIIAVDER